MHDHCNDETQKNKEVRRMRPAAGWGTRLSMVRG